MFLMAQPPHYTHVTKQTFSLHEGKGYVALSGMSFCSQQSVLCSVSLFELLKIRLFWSMGLHVLHAEEFYEVASR